MITSEGNHSESKRIGLVNTAREGRDGYVFFGSKKRAMKKAGPIAIDFKIKSIDEEMGERHRGLHFYIYFDHGKALFKINVFLLIESGCR